MMNLRPTAQRMRSGVGGGGGGVCVCRGVGGGGGTSLQITNTNLAHTSEYNAFNNHYQIKTVSNEHSQYL